MQRGEAAGAITQRIGAEAEPNRVVVAQLVQQGILENAAKRAVLVVQAGAPHLEEAEALTESHEWALLHENDADYAAPIPFGVQAVFDSLCSGTCSERIYERVFSDSCFESGNG